MDWERVAEVVLRTRSMEKRRPRNKEIKVQGRIIFRVMEITKTYDRTNIGENDSEPELKFSKKERE